MRTATPLQRRFQWADLGSCRPLLNVNAVMGILDRDEDAVLHLIEDGQLPFAFNIADAGAETRELRIWKGALPYIAEKDLVGEAVVKWSVPSLAQVVAEILPRADAATLRVEPELTRAFNCSATHVNDLIGQRELQEVVNPNRRATQTRVVTRASAALFLQRRRIV